MRCGIVMSSELTKHNRWDAGFHLLNQQYKDKAAALAKALSADEAVALLTDESVFSTKFLRVLEPLCRGNGNTGARGPLVKAIQEYPHLALAIVSDKAAAEIEAQQAELAQRAGILARVSDRLQAVEKLATETAAAAARAKASIEDATEEEAAEPANLGGGQAPKGLLPIPEDLEALLATHRFVAGVVYRDGDELVIPVHTSETHWLSDCWVIEVSEWVGPEMLDDLVNEGNVPVPRRYQDVGQPIGYVELPGHEQNYGMGWRR